MKHIKEAEKLFSESGLSHWIEPTIQYAEWNNCTSVVSKVKGIVVGFCMFDTDGFIWSVCVHPDHRSKGIGKKMVMKCINTYRSTKLFCEDSLVGYYEKMGFTLNLTESKPNNNKMEYNGRY